MGEGGVAGTTDHLAEKVAPEVESEFAEGGLAAGITAGVHGALIEALGIDALQTLGLDSVENDPQAEVVLEGVGVEEVAPLTKGEPETAASGADEEDGRGRSVEETAEVAPLAHVRSKKADPVRRLPTLRAEIKGTIDPRRANQLMALESIRDAECILPGGNVPSKEKERKRAQWGLGSHT